MKKTFALSLLIISSTVLTAQVNIKKCLTTPLVQQELKSNPDYVKGRAKSIAENSAWIAGNYNKKSTLDIPVAVHVVHRLSHVNVGTGTNISDVQIADALRILNEDYSKTNPEFPNPPRNTFLAYAGNPDLQFCLATTDPNGNPTTGITRTSTTKNSFDADDNTDSNAMKKDATDGKDGWDPSRYLNIWVCNLSNSLGGQTLGYAYLPGLWANQQWKDGLVVDYQYFGTVGAASPSSDGRTPTHEIGHYLGLEHTFCESQSGGCCDNDGSNVNDTPAADDNIYWGTVTSTTNNNTCNDLSYSNIFSTDVLDMDENYMSYASTTWMFSTAQVSVMDATLNGYRSSLQNSTVGMSCTGITPSWNCISLGNCQDPGTGNGQYTSLSSCQAACVITPSWECNNGVCSDPGTGQGTYASLVACQSNCVLPSWDCDGQGNCYDPGTGNGQYSTPTACASACVTPTWDCTGATCADPGNGSGAYTSLSACQNNCTVTATWDCINGVCYDPGTGQGAYASQSACNNSCVLATWECNNGVCSDPGTGQGTFASLVACQSNCVTATWDCTQNTCADPGTGQGAYTSLSACQNNCSVAATWNCNNGVCSDPGTGLGTYASLAGCQSNCVAVTPSWNCTGTACADPGTGNGIYTSLSACQSNCTVAETWECDGQDNCSDPGTGQGTFASLVACQSNCVASAIHEEISSLLIYPNPTKNTLTIDGNYISATIYDIFGKVVLNTDYQKTIDVAALSSGIYFINIDTAKGTRIEKIILSK